MFVGQVAILASRVPAVGQKHGWFISCIPGLLLKKKILFTTFLLTICSSLLVDSPSPGRAAQSRLRAARAENVAEAWWKTMARPQVDGNKSPFLGASPL